MKSICKLLFLFLIFVFSIPSNSALDIEPSEVLIAVDNVPVNEPSIFIPISLSSEEIDLIKIQLKDIFVKGYICSIERDENKKIIGISFASLNKKTLPKKLEAIIKIKHIRPPEALPTNYPKAVSINWQSPWVFTKVTKKLNDGYVGFSGLTLISSNSSEEQIKLLKKKKEESSDFYIKSFGQPLVRTERTGKKEKEYNLTEFPSIQNLDFFINTPKENLYQKLYIPIMIEHSNLLKLEFTDAALSQKLVLRIVNNNLIELASLNNEDLPKSIFVQGQISLKQSSQTISNKVQLGSLLSEPSRTLTGVIVFFQPNTITIKYNNFNPLNLF